MPSSNFGGLPIGHDCFRDGEGIGSEGFPIGRQGLANNYSYLSCTLLHLFTVKAVNQDANAQDREYENAKSKSTQSQSHSHWHLEWNIEIYNGLLVELFHHQKTLDYNIIQYTYHIMVCHVSFIIIPNISK